MEFDERDSHWENLLQGKASLSQSFKNETCCKVCLCLELLKLSTCKDSCFSPQEDSSLVDRLLQGILDPNTLGQITEKIRQHLNRIYFLSSFHDRLAEVENSLKKIRLNESGCGSAGYRKEAENKMDELIKRVENYENALIALRKENEDLRSQLKKQYNIFEENSAVQRKITAEYRGEFEVIKEEQMKIRYSIESLIKNANENAANLKDLKNKDLAKEDSEIKVFKLQVMEEVRGFNEETQNLIKKIQEAGDDLAVRIDETWSQIQDLKKEQENISNWQKEIKILNRHSSHLLIASDSVYAAVCKIQDINNSLEARLESLLKETALRIPSRKFEEVYHPGNYKFDEILQKFCWNCCKASDEHLGCVKR